MSEFIFSDVGSYPLPEAVTNEWMKNAFSKRDNDEELFSIIGSAFSQKLEAGVQVVTPPLFQDLFQQFLPIINDPDCVEEPFKVREDKARILELDAIEKVAVKYREETGEKPDVRVSVTGPLELYLESFGETQYIDILNLLAVSVNRFISNSMKSAKNFNIKTIGINGGSIGTNSNIMFTDDELVEALTIATSYAGKQGVDVEIHLHSPLQYEIPCNTPNINIIGVEYAATPSYLDLIDKKVLEDTDSFLRVGIARTDISNLTLMLNEKYNTNVWKDTQYLSKMVTEMETPDIISKRLQKVDSMFGGLIKYVGPDCGLRSWPSQEIAGQLLNNISRGIEKFYE